MMKKMMCMEKKKPLWRNLQWLCVYFHKNITNSLQFKIDYIEGMRYNKNNYKVGKEGYLLKMIVHHLLRCPSLFRFLESLWIYMGGKHEQAGFTDEVSSGQEGSGIPSF